MFILQVPPTSLIHEMTTKDLCRANSSRTLCLYIYGEGNVNLDRDMQKPGSSAHFPKRTGCTPWFYRMSAGTKLNCAFNNSGLNSTKKLNKKMIFFCIFQGLHLHKRNFRNLDNKCSYTAAECGKWKLSSNPTFSSTAAPLD